MKIEKSVNDLLGLHNILNELSKRKVPFSIALAKNIKVLKPTFEKFEDDKKELIDKSALTDENGTILGKFVQAGEGEEQVRIENPQQFDQIDWVEEDGLNKVLAALNTLGVETVEAVIYPIDVNREYFDSTSRQKETIRNYVDRELEASMVLYLDGMGMFKNLYDEDEE